MLLGFVSLIIASCDPAPEPQDAIDIPPVESMEFNFGIFGDDTGNRAGRQETEIAFGLSALTVGVWQALTAATMALPVTAFKKAISQQPTYDADADRWVWTYTVGDTTSAAHQLECNLYGSLSNDQINWEMRLTHAGNFTDFLWFSGVSKVDKSAGNWVIHRDPLGNSRPFMEVEWTRDTTNNTGTIRYINVDKQSIGNGNYIEAGRKDDPTYDSYFIISGAVNQTEIEWNKTTKAGRVRRGNGEWSCWDESLQDVDCTN